MSINVSQSFHRTSANAVDDTLTLTKAQMLAVDDNLMPSKYLTVCQDDGLIYLYNKANTVDSTTGKFRVFESGGGGHEIEDDSGTALTQRETMQFGDGFNVSDDSTNEKTVVEPNLMTSADMDDVVTPLPGTFARYHKYSTTEQVVGEWVDGSLLYERTFIGVSPTESSITTGATQLKYLLISEQEGQNLKYIGFSNFVLHDTRYANVATITSFAGATGTLNYSAQEMYYTYSIGQSGNAKEIAVTQRRNDNNTGAASYSTIDITVYYIKLT